MKSTSFSKEAFIFPIAILVSAWLTFEITKNVIAAAIMATAVFIIFVCSMIANVQNYYQLKCKNQIQIWLAVNTFAILGFALLHYNLHLERNSWGMIQWVILTGAFVLAITLPALINDDSTEKTVVVLRALSAVAAASQVYLFFGSQLIWLPLVMYGGLATFIISREAYDWSEDKEFETTSEIVLGLGSLSTIIQFWNSRVVFGYTLWQVLLAVAILAICLTVIVAVIKSMKRKNKKERECAEQKRKEREYLESLDQLINKIDSSETSSWNDLIEFKRLSGGKPSFERIAKAKLIDIFQVSDVKMRITWNGGEMDSALEMLDKVFVFCYEDTLLTQAIDQVKALEKFDSYAGYDTLRNLLSRYQNIWQLVQLKEKEVPIASHKD